MDATEDHLTIDEVAAQRGSRRTTSSHGAARSAAWRGRPVRRGSVDRPVSSTPSPGRRQRRVTGPGRDRGQRHVRLLPGAAPGSWRDLHAVVCGPQGTWAIAGSTLVSLRVVRADRATRHGPPAGRERGAARGPRGDHDDAERAWCCGRSGSWAKPRAGRPRACCRCTTRRAIKWTAHRDCLPARRTSGCSNLGRALGASCPTSRLPGG